MNNHITYVPSTQPVTKPDSARYGDRFTSILKTAVTPQQTHQVSKHERQRSTISTLYKLRKPSPFCDLTKYNEVMESLTAHPIGYMFKYLVTNHISEDKRKFKQKEINSLVEILSFINCIGMENFNFRYGDNKPTLTETIEFKTGVRLFGEYENVHGEKLTRKNTDTFIRGEVMKVMADDISYLPFYMKIVEVLTKIDSRKTDSSFLRAVSSAIVTTSYALVNDFSNAGMVEFIGKFITDVEESEIVKIETKKKRAKSEQQQQIDFIMSDME